jgi:hypothetical protein
MPVLQFDRVVDRVVVPEGSEQSLSFGLKTSVPDIRMGTFMVANEHARQVECQSTMFHPNYQPIKMSGGGLLGLNEANILIHFVDILMVGKLMLTWVLSFSMLGVTQDAL